MSEDINGCLLVRSFMIADMAKRPRFSQTSLYEVISTRKVFISIQEGFGDPHAHVPVSPFHFLNVRPMWLSAFHAVTTPGAGYHGKI